jgi:hypothetical protein
MTSPKCLKLMLLCCADDDVVDDDYLVSFSRTLVYFCKINTPRSLTLFHRRFQSLLTNAVLINQASYSSVVVGLSQ